MNILVVKKPMRTHPNPNESIITLLFLLVNGLLQLSRMTKPIPGRIKMYYRYIIKKINKPPSKNMKLATSPSIMYCPLIRYAKMATGR